MPNNEKLKNIAIKILQKTNVPKEDHYGFAIVTILMIISIVLTIIRVIQECQKNKLSSDCTMTDKCSLYGEEIKTYSVKRGWFTKMRIKKIMRREMSPEDYNKYSMSILSALLDTGEILTDEEVVTLVEAANV
jgi:putative component of membrane protein insertase Oxa1/YidC/SpoIIIJ protein YidD